MAYALELKDITKRFPGVLALDNMCLQVEGRRGPRHLRRKRRRQIDADEGLHGRLSGRTAARSC
jgi:hypothetical protein